MSSKINFQKIVGQSIAIILIHGCIAVQQCIAQPLPANSGIINVKDYGAKGDSITDDTQAIQTAIQSVNRNNSKHVTIYFPNGTYVVSNSLKWLDSQGKWWPYLSFEGESQAKAIIKLKNYAPGYNDPNYAKAVIITGSQNPKLDGGGNEGFRNSIYDLTVDTGIGNLGAIGIDYIANNKGAIRDVIIRGQGKYGLNLSREWPGPNLIKNVIIDGFDYGIASLNHYQYGITFEHITLTNQKLAGITNKNNVLSIRGLTSINSVPVIQNTSKYGFVTLLDSKFSGGLSTVSAVENTGTLYARNITTTGYQSAIKNKGVVLAGTTVAEFASTPFQSLFSSPQTSLNLPIADPPSFSEDVSQWVSVTAFGAKPDDNNDDTAAIQRAIDSGKSTVYFPTGVYNISSTLRIRNNVRKLMGMESFLKPRVNQIMPSPAIRFEPGNYDGVTVERLNVKGVWEHSSPQTLVLRDCAYGSYQGSVGAGSLFGENVMIGKWQFSPGQKVWLRQLNTEFTNATRLINNGAKLWILGIKTEDPYTVIETKGGGQTEVLGGLLYPGHGNVVPTTDVALVNNESQVSFVYATAADATNQDYTIHVQTTKNGVTKTLRKSAVPSRGNGSVILYRD
ncbi:glycosyl hydrolase family 28-related protein [Synechocystis sp. PCC 7509]|uniref:glycosyl hydrolase family 28-related protein n=1 Tax=Synechocystis sp. PCC 7509 TaxID=927677 RepID=UPI0002ABACD3|nr:glycosyl hydrolase family 28-related protein [Synechocystis sp. PCC 7509]